MDIVDLIKKGENKKKVLSKIKRIKKNDINKNIGGEGPLLCWCSFLGHLESVKLLIKKGADINMKSSNGNTPLMWSCISGSKDVFQLFLDHPYIDLLGENNKGENILFSLCDNLIGIDLFLEVKRRVGVQYFRRSCDKISKNGQTMISYCIQSIKNKKGGDMELNQSEIFQKIETIVKEGGDVKKKIKINDYDLNYIDFVNNNNLIRDYPDLAENMINLLISLGANGKNVGKNSDIFYIYCFKGDISTVKELHKIGYDINQKREGKTSLMIAIENNNFEVAKFLLANGADLKIRDTDGLTASHYAVETDFNEFTKEILELDNIRTTFPNEYRSYGINIPPKYNLLHLACGRGNLVLLNFLKQKGLEIENKDKCSISPRDILLESKTNVELLKFITEPVTDYKIYAKNKRNEKIFESTPECSICYDNLINEITVLKCGHVFHTDCIIQHLSASHKPKCPICREELKLKYKVKLPERIYHSSKSPKTRKKSRSRTISTPSRRRFTSLKKSRPSSVSTPKSNSLKGKSI